MPGCSRTMGVAGSLLLSLIVGDSAIANATTDRLERDAALPFLVAQAGGLHGTEPSDERNRSGPNGYVQAPIPRDEAPSGPLGHRDPREHEPEYAANSRGARNGQSACAWAGSRHCHADAQHREERSIPPPRLAEPSTRTIRHPSVIENPL